MSACTTHVAALPVQDYSLRIARKRFSRAFLHTLAAADTSAFPVDQLIPWILTLRVVAPPAPQRASLKKNRGPNPRPVMDGILFDVEDSALSNE